MPARFTIPCSHLLEPHVVYDKAGSGYRAQLRCRRYKVVRLGKRVRERVVDAEADARAMLVVKPRPPKLTPFHVEPTVS